MSLLSLVRAVVFVAAAPSFAAAFVSVEVREQGLTYVRISAWTVMGGVAETAW